jgi:hypothetical protein
VKRSAWIFCAVLALAMAARPQQPVNQGSLVLEDFHKRVADYVELHKTARSEVHGLKPTKSPEEIAHYEHRLAARIKELRRGATEGAIFTPEICNEFRRLIRIAMQGSAAKRVEESLNHAEPVHLPQLRIDSAYPEGIPLQSTPPSVLMNLPPLPQEVEYRVVGHDLALRDVDANLIVDVMRNVVP